MTCWIQQPVSPKQVVGLTCGYRSEVDQSVRKLLVNRSVVAFCQLVHLVATLYLWRRAVDLDDEVAINP